MILLTAFLLAAQPASKPRPAVSSRRATAVAAARPTADWLKGLWVAEQDKGVDMEGCASWTALFFQADGQYLHGEVTGRWALAGNKLARQEIAYAEGGGDEEQVVDERLSRIVRLSNDRLREVGADGKATVYLRCPAPETPNAL